MRQVNSTFKTQKNSASNQPIRLYTLEDYDGLGSNLYFAQWDIDIVFDGVTYTRFPISSDAISENNRGTVDTVTLKISNVSRLIQSYLEDFDLRGKKVTIRTVWADQLADTSAYIDDVFYIDSYTANQMDVQFVLTSKFDVLDIELPLRKYSRNYCQWKFKGVECGYAGAEAACNKTKARCKELSNYQRFGGFPSIQSSKVFLG